MIYEPNKLKLVIEEAENERNMKESKNAENVVLSDEYIALFKRMADKAKTPRMAQGLRYCLSKRELPLLVEYYFAEDNEYTEALTPVILEDLDDTLASALYPQLVERYNTSKGKKLAENLKNSKVFADNIKRKHGLAAAELLDAVTEGSLAEFMNSEAGIRSGGNAESYASSLAELEVREGSDLYTECMSLYMLVCDARAYLTLGCTKLTEIAQNFTKHNQASLLRNMLTCLDSYQLRNFVPMLDLFFEVTGDIGSKTYTEALMGLSKEITDKYDLLVKQQKIYNALGDSDRAKFWYGYTENANMVHMEKIGALLIVFSTFVCVEPCAEDAAYFYDIEYYNDNVKRKLVDFTTCDEAFAFLKNKTEWAAEGEHPKRWRRAHTGNWQLDFKKHIMDQKGVM